MPFIFLTILLSVYGQLIIKWQVTSAGVMPEEMIEKLISVSKLLMNPWILSGFAAGVLAAMSWMIAISKLQLSYAYPFVSLTFVLILIFSSLLFSEPITWPKIFGLIFIVIGVSISANG